MSNEKIKELKKIIELQRQEIEKLSKNSNSVFDKIIAAMPGHIFWKNRESVYLGCNDQTAIRAGLKSRNDIIGKTDYELSWKKYAKNLIENDKYVMNSGKLLTKIEDAIIANGEKRIYLSHKYPLFDENKKIIGLLGISLDITAEKQAETLRLEKVKAEQSQKDAETEAKRMKELAFTIAHEMRTPLLSIGALGHNVQKPILNLLSTYQLAEEHGLDVQEISNKNKNTLQHLSEKIEHETQKASLTINLLLENIRQDKLDKQHFVPCHIKEIIELAIDRYPMTELQQQKVHNQIKTDFTFLGNQELLIHVIFNLLKNALYYTADKGEIYINSSHTNTHSILHFKDTGEGIEPNVLPHIFEQFYSQTYHGTGLGLAFCKRVMENMGGKISCQSKFGEYTEFSLYFPKE